MVGATGLLVGALRSRSSVPSAVRLTAARPQNALPSARQAVAAAHAASAPARKRRRMGRLIRCRWT